MYDRRDRRSDPEPVNEPSLVDLTEDVEVRIPVSADRWTSLGGWRMGAIVVIGIVVVGIGLAGPKDVGRNYLDLSNLLPGRSPTAAPSVPPRTAPPRPTPLPPLEVFAPGGPTDPIPVYAGLPSTLDPLDGTIRPLSPDLQQGVVVADGAGGSLCVCVLHRDRAGALETEIVAIRWDEALAETERRSLATYRSSIDNSMGWVGGIDVGITHDHATAIVASAFRPEDAHVYRVDAFDLASGRQSWSLQLAERPAFEHQDPAGSPTPTPDAVPPGSQVMPGTRVIGRVALRMPPAGDAIAVSIQDGVFRSGDTVDWSTSAWRLRTHDLVAGPADVVALDAADTDVVCEEGFVASDIYVEVCPEWSPEGGTTSTIIRIGLPDGTPVQEVDLGPSRWFYGPSLVNLDTGMLYLWEQSGHELVQVDPVAGEARRSLVPSATGGDIDVVPAVAEVTLSSGRARWAGLASGLEWWLQPTLVGSADGRYLYAAGIQFGPSAPDFRDVRSTGIVVFDAQTLEPIRRIAPIAIHDSISLTGDGRYLLATGMRGYDEAGLAGNWQRSLSIFDAQGGHPLMRIGDVGMPGRGDFALVWPPRSP